MHSSSNPHDPKPGTWKIDLAGEVSPEGYRREKYFHVIKQLDTGYKGYLPVTSKHSAVTKKVVQEFAAEVRAMPKEMHCDGGTEYKGDHARWLLDTGCVTVELPRYSPWLNGAIECEVGAAKRGVATIMSERDIPKKAWPVVLKWFQDTGNLMLKSWDKVHGQADGVATRRRMVPFGTVATFVKEVPEKMNGDTFQSKTVTGFVAGYRPHGVYRVGYFCDGHLRVLLTQNVKVYPGRYYFPETKGEARFDPDAEIAQREEKSLHEDEELDTWAECTRCGKWRHIEDNERESVRQAQAWRCEDAGLSCVDAEDQAHLHHREVDRDVDQNQPRKVTAYFSEKPEGMLPDKDADGRCAFLTKVITRRQAFSEEPFGDTDQTWRQLTDAAIQTEMQKYADTQALADEPEELDDVLKKCPDAQVAWLNIIYTVKYWELPWSERKVAVRFVGVGSHQLGQDPVGQLVWTEGVQRDENLWSSPPSLWAARTVTTVGTLSQLVGSTEDFRGAYLQTPLSGPAMHVFKPPDALHAKHKSMKQPVFRVSRAIYGFVRSGFDFEEGARQAARDLGWVSLREVDSEPCVYVRELSGASPPLGPELNKRLLYKGIKPFRDFDSSKGFPGEGPHETMAQNPKLQRQYFKDPKLQHLNARDVQPELKEKVQLVKFKESQANDKAKFEATLRLEFDSLQKRHEEEMNRLFAAHSVREEKFVLDQRQVAVQEEKRAAAAQLEQLQQERQVQALRRQQEADEQERAVEEAAKKEAAKKERAKQEADEKKRAKKVAADKNEKEDAAAAVCLQKYERLHKAAEAKVRFQQGEALMRFCVAPSAYLAMASDVLYARNLDDINFYISNS